MISGWQPVPNGAMHHSRDLLLLTFPIWGLSRANLSVRSWDLVNSGIYVVELGWHYKKKAKKTQNQKKSTKAHHSWQRAYKKQNQRNNIIESLSKNTFHKAPINGRKKELVLFFPFPSFLFVWQAVHRCLWACIPIFSPTPLWCTIFSWAPAG